MQPRRWYGIIGAGDFLGRYPPEYGEVSITRNFTVENVFCHLAVIPLYMTLAYYIFEKRLLSQTNAGQTR